MKNDGKQFKFNIPLSMSLSDILENMGITVGKMIDDIISKIENPGNYPPSIEEMKSFKESFESFYDITQTQQAMLGMEKTADEKKREFIHVLNLNNAENKNFFIEASDIEEGLEITASIRTI